MALLAVLLFCGGHDNLSAQIPIKNPIIGESGGDQSGGAVSVSADGNRVAIGASLNSGNGFAAGHARVYHFFIGSWSRLDLDDKDGENGGDRAGSAVALSADGNWLAVGAPNNGGNGINAGHVRVFQFDGNRSYDRAGMDIDGEAAGDESGTSVALSADGSRVAVGAPKNSSGAGHVRIHEFVGGSWIQVGADIDGEAAGDESGTSVALSADGNRVAIGAPLNTARGHVRIYEYANGAWTQMGADIDGESGGDQSGISVALSDNGDRLAVGAPFNDGTAADAGHVRIYEYANGAWTQLGADIDGESGGDQSGISVDLSADGTRVAIGANQNAGNGAGAGHTRVFDLVGGNWMQVYADIDASAAGDEAGTSVSLSADGNILGVGAPRHTGNGQFRNGQVRMFDMTIDATNSCLPNGTSFSTQTVIDDFPTRFPGCSVVLGSITIDQSNSPDITNLDGLSQITVIGGDLLIRSNLYLTDLGGLSGLTQVRGALEIEENRLITNMNGLENLTRVDGLLEFRSNSGLEDLTGLENLDSLGNGIRIWANSSLTSLDGLTKVKSTAGLDISFNPELINLGGLSALTSTRTGNLKIEENHKLTSLSGLENLTSVHAHLELLENELLADISSLSNVTNVGGYIRVIDNPALPNLDGFSGLTTMQNSLLIGHNTSLTDITGLSNLTTIDGRLDLSTNPIADLNPLSGITSINGQLGINGTTATTLEGIENIDPTTITVLSIRQNVNLSVCNLPNICSYLATPSNSNNISDNQTNCNSSSEIYTECFSNSWASGGDGDWGTGGNWEEGTTPSAETVAMIDGAVTVTISGSAEAFSVELANGAHLVIDGDLTVPFLNRLVIPDGCIISGTGTINGTIEVNGGDFSVGSSPGRMTLNGDIQFLAGTNVVEINGVTAGTQYDQLVASGNAIIGNKAKLHIAFGGGFKPDGTESFDIITAGNVFGAFVADSITFSGGNVLSVAVSYPGGNKVRVVATPIPPVRAGIYWGDDLENDIQRANLDGSEVENIVTGIDNPRGITIDTAARKLYWTDDIADKIQSIDVDGSGTAQTVLDMGLSHPFGIALDPNGGKLYWTDVNGQEIRRVDTNGTGSTPLVTSGLSSPFGIALDLSNNEMYWTDLGNSEIRKAGLDGSSPQTILSVADGLDSPFDIAVDPANSKIYWADTGSKKIMSANTDGSLVTPLVETGLMTPKGIALDLTAGKIYWTDVGTKKIQQANLDGTGVVDIVTSVHLDDPEDIEVVSCGFVAAFAFSGVVTGTTVNFTDNSTGVSGGASYAWDFDNDGMKDAVTAGNVSYTYAAPGLQTAKLTITDNGCQSTVTVVFNLVPVCDDGNVCTVDTYQVGVGCVYTPVADGVSCGTGTCSGGVCTDAFVTTWQTTGNNETITIPTTGTGYNYLVAWGDGTYDTGQTGNATHTYISAGSYSVTITGNFPRIFFNGAGDKDKIMSIDQWGLNGWTSMADAFEGCSNLTYTATDIPDLTNVTDLSNMFVNATSFNGDLNAWDVSNVTNMRSMFSNATSFNQDLNNWDVSKVTTMKRMFFGATAFNGSLAGWDLANALNLSLMFRSATSFNQPLSSWINTGNISNFRGMFLNATAFNQALNSWDVSGATDMGEMFLGATSFDQPLNSWNVSGVALMDAMFRGALAFNSNLGGWVLTGLTDATNMFDGATAFNQPIGDWDFSMNVTTGIICNGLFNNAGSFNQPLNNWNVSNVIDMKRMFANTTSFNQPLDSWNVARVTTMEAMFANAASFDQDLGSWNVSMVGNMGDMLDNTALSTINYDNLLKGWAALPVQFGVSLGASGVRYCGAQSERQSLIDAPNNWVIDDGGQSCIAKVKLTGILQGNFSPVQNTTIQMHDNLRTGPMLRTTSPYPDALTCDPSVFNNGGTSGAGETFQDIVDWVWLELRADHDAGLVIDSRSALLRRDGTVVDVDGVTDTIIFEADPAEKYYVVLKHRNHLGVMTSEALPLRE